MIKTSDTTNAEEVIFYIDLTTEYIKKNILTKEIRSFIENKNKISQYNSYGLVIFQESDNPICLYDQKDYEPIISVLEEKWDSRTKDQSYIENAIFEMLSYVFMKSRTIQKNYRLMVISDTPSRRSEEYHQAVYDLILKSKNFSTIIDIIRVGDEESYEDDVKIKVITSETYGGTFYCDKNQFKDVFGSLVKSKSELNIIQGSGECGQVLEEDRDFYEHLAVDLISLDSKADAVCDICQFDLCPLCGAYSDEVHKCFNCGAKFHNCCIARYSITNNIGFKHIFRCPKCQSLLKIDESFVNLLLEEEYEERTLEKIETKNNEIRPLNNYVKEIQNFVEKQDTKEPIDEKVESSPAQNKLIEEFKINLQSLPPPPPLKKVKIGGFFGGEVEINASKSEKSIKILEIPLTEETKSISQLSPPKKRTNIKFCKICGASVKNLIVCPNCGAPIE